MASTSTDKQFTYDLLEVKINEKDKKVSCKLKIPSKLPPRYDSEDLGENPALLLALQCNSYDGLRCFQMMKEIIHPNILHARAINVTKSQLLLWVEPYTNTSNLLEYLKVSMGVNYQRSPPEVVLPTKILLSIVSQVIDGLNHLRTQGFYHGNFTMKSTYYLEIDREIFVKLTNFKEKGAKKSLSLCQCEDLKDLGTELTELSSIADMLNQKNKTGQTLDSTYLVDLADKLKLVTDLPWDTKDHNGFLPKMKQFRLNNGLRAYNRMSRKVDETVTKFHPRIFLVLSNLLQPSDEDWM